MTEKETLTALKNKKKQKLEAALLKLALTPGKASTNYNICKKLRKQLNELNKKEKPAK